MHSVAGAQHWIKFPSRHWQNRLAFQGLDMVSILVRIARKPSLALHPGQADHSKKLLFAFVHQDAAVKAADVDLHAAAVDGAAGGVIQFQLGHSLGLRSLQAA